MPPRDLWRPAASGLYDPRHEKDACGVGFVCQKDGLRSHQILRFALAALANCEHRGAVSSDGKTGDGAGVLTQLPHELFAAELPALPAAGRYGVGMFFLPPDEAAAAACRKIVEEEAGRGALRMLAWRVVPIDAQAVGEQARATCPRIEQFFAAAPEHLGDDALERRLFLVRKRIENRVRTTEPNFYVPSFSCRTIVYKGLMVAGQLDRFFADLARPEYATALALFHQRYSTNTHPTWPLAHPFRLLAHNGEINTIQGNILRMWAREPALRSPLWTPEELRELRPIVQPDGSDSSALDNALELIVRSARTPLHALAMLIPEAYKDNPDLSRDLKGFYDYHSGLVEPWDGPAALAVTDGRWAVAALDRNGLRPLRYWRTDDGFVAMGSEAGIVPLPAERIVEKGRLGPGTMFAVDTATGRVLHDGEIKVELAARQPYADWVNDFLHRDPDLPDAAAHAANERAETLDAEGFVRLQKAFGYGEEDIERLLEAMAYEAKEPVGSMGDDTPLAVFSQQPQPLYRYFKQLFAQVTNPPIDPLREKLVMSLDIQIGARGALLVEEPQAAQLLRYRSPILTNSQMQWLREAGDGMFQFKSRTLPCLIPVAAGPEGLEKALETLCAAAHEAVDAGCSLLILSDRGVDAAHAPIPMLLATGAVHHELIRAGVRMKCAVLCETGEPREDHHFACLIAFGASLVNPYLALAGAGQVGAANPRKEAGFDGVRARANYRQAIDGGLLKILSKMGISTLASYRGAQIFEAIGLGPQLVERHFFGTASRIGGIETTDLARDVLRFHAEAFGQDPKLRDRGVYHYLSRDGEYHALNPLVFKALHKAVRTESFDEYRKYADLVDQRPACSLRDLLDWRPAGPALPLDQVESAEEIAKRFCTQAMSHGAVSRETHEALGIAMNRLGGKSNSGEGGEERTRFQPYETGYQPKAEWWHSDWKPQPGDWASSRIKQVASGRFGVTPEYLVNADELEIKLAQGSKPGEGGQIPGFKVSDEIASIRRSQPGVTLISPPPHHDIYSIEDLAQLIYDLKRVNRTARVCVKLVSVVGVGTIAAGVAKGYADSIQISGNDGGTGASPLASIKHAGLPWELGLAETQQTLVKNGLRGRVKLRVDGGMKTGRDVVLGALLGAEEYGFGTTALVAAGCVMARRCHLNNCPVGIASQRPDLRKKFPGTPEHIVNFMLYVAQQVRMILAELGVKTLGELIGRTDLLRQRTGMALPKAGVDLAKLLADPDPAGSSARRWNGGRNDRPETAEPPLDEKIFQAYLPLLAARKPWAKTFPITNRERSVGARLSGEIARVFKDKGLPVGTVKLTFEGASGQSFGAFCNTGMALRLVGEAQDYVGKGMHGGEIVLTPPPGARYAAAASAIMGNTCLYGATGGRLFAAGRAGERFAVRNSGGLAVVEGVGDHGCEYMTNGVVAILGPVGRNFGAGMSGGVAFVLDLDEKHVNPGMVGCEAVDRDTDRELLQAMLQRHAETTGSARARQLLAEWPGAAARFVKVRPHPGKEDQSAHEQDTNRLEAIYLRELLATAIDGAEETDLTGSLVAAT